MSNDSDFVAYYQFNDSGTQILDRIGTRHGSLTGTSSLLTSTGPFGGGDSDVHTITSDGTYTYVNGNVTLEIGNQGTLPDGDVWVSLINQLPNKIPDNIENVMSYFIINNYGDDTFTANHSLTYNDPLSSPLLSSTESPQSLSLYHREENGDAPSWTEICNTATVNGEEYQFAVCNPNGLDHQYFIYKECLDSAVEVDTYTSGDIQALVVNETIEATNSIQSGADVIYKAGEEVLLDNGFCTEAGAVLLIGILRCDE